MQYMTHAIIGRKLAVAFGYEESDLKDAAGAANMGLSVRFI